MTLATLKGMNVSMGDVANAFKFQGSDAVMQGMQKRPMPSAVPHGLPHRRRLPRADSSGTGSSPCASSCTQPRPGTRGRCRCLQGEAPRSPGVVDALHWWGADHPVPGDCRQRLERRQPPRQPLGATQHLAKDALKKATDMASHLAAQGVQSLQEVARAAQAAKPAAAPRKAPSRSAAAPKPAPAKSAGSQRAAPAPAGKSGRASAKAPAARKTAAKKAPAKRLPPSHRASGEGGVAHPPQVARWPVSAWSSGPGPASFAPAR